MVDKAATIPIQLAATASGVNLNPFSSILRPSNPYEFGDPGTIRRPTGPTYDELQTQLQEQSLQQMLQDEYSVNLEREIRLQNLRDQMRNRQTVPDQSNTLIEEDDLPSDQQIPDDQIQQEIQQEQIGPIDPLQDPGYLERQARINAIFQELNAEEQNQVNQAIQQLPQNDRDSFLQYLQQLGIDYIRYQILGENAGGISFKRKAGFIAVTELIKYLYDKYKKSDETIIIKDGFTPSIIKDPPIITDPEYFNTQEIDKKLPAHCKSEIIYDPQRQQKYIRVTCRHEHDSKPRFYYK